MIRPVRHHAEFALLRATGGYRRSGPLGLRSALDPDDDVVRVAYAIGRRVGGAVVRNRVRRRCREIIAQLDRDEQLRGGRYLVIVTPDAVAASFEDLALHLRRLMLFES